MAKKSNKVKQIGMWAWNSELVLSKVDKKSDLECWPWMGGSISPGAPLFGARKNGRAQMTQAARILYREYYNEDCEEKEVAHECGSKLCMNPAHWKILDVKKHGAVPREIKQSKLKPVRKPRSHRWWSE